MIEWRLKVIGSLRLENVSSNWTLSLQPKFCWYNNLNMARMSLSSVNRKSWGTFGSHNHAHDLLFEISVDKHEWLTACRGLSAQVTSNFKWSGHPSNLHGWPGKYSVATFTSSRYQMYTFISRDTQMWRDQQTNAPTKRVNQEVEQQ